MKNALLIYCILGILFSSSSVCAQAQSSSYADSDTEYNTALKKEALRLVKAGDIVELRRNVGTVFAAGAIFEKEGDFQQAMLLYEKALEADAWELNYQLRLAQLAAKTGDKQKALEKARLVYKYAEDVSLSQDAKLLLLSLGEKIEPQRPQISVLKNIEIILVPLGNIDQRLIEELRYELEKNLGFSFKVSEKSQSIGRPDRTGEQAYVNNVYLRLSEKMPSEYKNIVFNELGVSEGEIKSLDKKISFIHKVFEHSGQEGRIGKKQFDKQLEEARQQVQYDTARLLPELKRDFSLLIGSSVKGYLALTQEDIFEGTSNFRFGAALPGYAVVSYHRFLASFAGEHQNRPHLLDRTLKQAISSSLFVLNIPRCTNPDCVRAYPHSLKELDEKPLSLCPICSGRLEDYKNFETVSE